MAGLVVCDICNEVVDMNHPNPGFVKAIVHVRASAMERSTVSAIEQVDACANHIKEAVMSLWDAHRVVPNFYEITITKV
jgi:hypothetical protein